MRLLDVAPDDAPGACCYLCGNSYHSDGTAYRVIDVERVISYEGRLVICEVCVGAMADLFGYSSPAMTTALHLELADAQADACGYAEQVDDLEGKLDACKRTIETFGAEKMLAEVAS